VTRRIGMISYSDIRQLQQLPSSPDSLVLSLYVTVNQADAANLNRGFETKVENLFRQIGEGQSGGNHKQKFEAECQRVLEFLRSYVPKGKSLVIFSDSSNDLLWYRDLQVEFANEGRWSEKPWLRPLLEVVEDSDRFGVVLVDKQRARVLTVDASGMEQQAEVLSDVPNKHVTTGTDHIWSQTQMERDHTKHVHWHVKRVVDELAAVIDRTKISQVVVGGPVEATSAFINELPKRLEQMVIGTISVPLDVNYERLVAELRAVQEETENEDEANLVDSMITAAMKGDRAVLGITETLRAIQEQRVYRMVVARGYRMEGKECDSCRVLVVGGEDNCSFCGGQLRPAPDLINRASHRVLEQAGKVMQVAGAAADKLAGIGVGAVLRF
jgi:hypothetical protein